jgi:lytic murein transglycosylase
LVAIVLNRSGMIRLLLASLILVALALPASAQPTESFDAFLRNFETRANAAGVTRDVYRRATAGLTLDPNVPNLVSTQPEFTTPMWDYIDGRVTTGRIERGRKAIAANQPLFDAAGRAYGVDPYILAAIWGMETDYGAVLGNTKLIRPVIRSLATLVHQRRGRLKEDEADLIAALLLVQREAIEPATLVGSWAGAIGHLQVNPSNVVRYGTDGDGNGHVNLKDSEADVILTAARFIQSLGFNRGEPWIQEVTLPENLPFEKTGLGGPLTAAEWFALGVQPRDGNTSFGHLKAAIALPQGRKGPAFMTYPNFGIYLEWNQSFIYTTSAAYFATRLAGAPTYQKGNPDAGLSPDEMKALQEKLQALGHDVGKIDGILGGGTRVAIQKEQQRLGMAADGWATRQLLDAL